MPESHRLMAPSASYRGTVSPMPSHGLALAVGDDTQTTKIAQRRSEVKEGGTLLILDVLNPAAPAWPVHRPV